MILRAAAAVIGAVVVAAGFALSPAPWLALIWLGLVVGALGLFAG